LHRIVTGDEEWIHCDNLKRKKSWVKPMHQHPWQSRISMPTSLCSVFDGISIVLCITNCSNLTKPLQGIGLQLMRLNRALKEKRPQYEQKYDKVIFQHDNARPHIAQAAKTYLEMLGNPSPSAVPS